jgi:hypothetical protein
MKIIKNGLDKFCAKEVVGKYEISIAFDDWNESDDIRIFCKGEDITETVITALKFDYEISATIDNLMQVYIWCKNN